MSHKFSSIPSYRYTGFQSPSNWNNFIETLAYKQLGLILNRNDDLEFNMLWYIFQRKFNLDIETVISASGDIDDFTSYCLRYQFSSEKAQHCFAKTKSMRSLAMLLLLIVRDIIHMLRAVNTTEVAQKQHLTDLIALLLTGAKLSANFICSNGIQISNNGVKAHDSSFFERAIKKLDLGTEPDSLSSSSSFYRVFTCLGYQRESIFEERWDCSDLIRELVDLNNSLQKFISIVHFTFPHPIVTLLPSFTRNFSKSRLEVKFKKIIRRVESLVYSKKSTLNQSKVVVPKRTTGTKLRYGHWDQQEEIKLINAVNKFGEGNWTKSASVYFLNTRTGTQLRDKWQNLIRYGHVTRVERGNTAIWIMDMSDTDAIGTGRKGRDR